METSIRHCEERAIASDEAIPDIAWGIASPFGLQRRKHKLYIILPALFKNKKQDFLNNMTYKLEALAQFIGQLVNVERIYRLLPGTQFIL
jgi:hypothetical protein